VIINPIALEIKNKEIENNDIYPKYKMMEENLVNLN